MSLKYTFEKNDKLTDLFPKHISDIYLYFFFEFTPIDIKNCGNEIISKIIGNMKRTNDKFKSLYTQDDVLDLFEKRQTLINFIQCVIFNFYSAMKKNRVFNVFGCNLCIHLFRHFCVKFKKLASKSH